MIYRVELRPREGRDPAVCYAEAGTLEVLLETLRAMGLIVVQVEEATGEMHVKP